MAVFVLDFPDAISPQEVGENNDIRLLGVATDRMTFALVPARP